MNKNIKISALILFLVFGLSKKTIAQTDTTKNNVFGGFLIIPIEFPIIEKSSLDRQLNDLGFPSAKYSTASLGIGFQLYLNRFITTFAFNKNTKKNDEDTYLTEVEYRSTSFNLGYDLTKSQLLSIYPYIGFKGSGLNYLYREKIEEETSLNNYLQTDLKYKEITNSRAHLDLGFGLSHQWFYLVNFRFGYLLPIENIRWNINNNKTSLTNSPKIKYSYYFTLTISFSCLLLSYTGFSGP